MIHSNGLKLFKYTQILNQVNESKILKFPKATKLCLRGQ